MSYEKNEETDVDLVARLDDRFHNTGAVMPPSQRQIYEAIAESLVVNDKQSAKKTVADIGCGLGIGSNILAREARFVWGVDKNGASIDFANQMFGGTSKLRFDNLDARETPREIAKFDSVVCVEVIEHVSEPEKVILFIKRLMRPYPKSVAWISSPNRNSPELGQDKPKNPHHVSEMTASELYDLCIKHFKYVVIFGPDLKTTYDLDTKVTPLILKCEEPY